MTRYLDDQNKALEEIEEKLNEMFTFFKKVANLETFVIENIYEEYLNLIKVRENRSNLEKTEGTRNYINDYFLKAAFDIEDKLEKTLERWDNDNEDYSIDNIKESILKLKDIKYKISNGNLPDHFVECNKGALNFFANFKIYKMITLDSTLDKIELLLSFKDELITENENTNIKIKEKKLSIDDL